jgi:hypothetical protein
MGRSVEEEETVEKVFSDPNILLSASAVRFFVHFDCFVQQRKTKKKKKSQLLNPNPEREKFPAGKCQTA